MKKISELHIYPIKSMAGIALQGSKLDFLGLQDDRRMMLIDDDGVFLTQRSLSILALFKLSALDNTYEVSYQNEKIELPAFRSEKVSCSVWEKPAKAFVAESHVNTFFSDALDQKVRLVRLDENAPLIIENDSKANGKPVGFSDGYPTLLVSQESLDFLNSKLKAPVPMNRFRPNIVVTGCAPHEEDEWKAFQINSVEFTGIKPCGRCELITIDQQTLESSKEPMKTLATYRNVGNRINFGFNIFNSTNGEIAVGQEVKFG